MLKTLFAWIVFSSLTLALIPGAADKDGVVAAATARIEGTVVDGRPVSTPEGTGLVIPTDLKPVTGATLTIPNLDIEVLTDDAGAFAIDGLEVSVPYTKVDIEVRAKGFGQWQFIGYPVRANVGVNKLYVELSSTSQTLTVTPVEERKERLSNSAVGQESLDSSCSGYFSNDTPPATIRVWMKTWGETFVRTYGFQFYVKNVLPNEWGPSWQAESLKAGATAVKNYGWYWVNYWRGGRAPNGECYDVNDDWQNYQYFVPGSQIGTTDSAVDAIWGWNTRKYGTIFETSYWSGYSGEACGYGANGWQMRQFGTKTCADGGMGWKQIVTTYYYPGVTFTCAGGGPWSAWEDLGGPSITSAPAAAAWDCNRLDVFALGTSNYVWHKWYDGVRHPWENMGFVGTSAPAVASWGPGRLDVFVRGTDGALWHQWFEGAWSAWESLGGTIASSSPQLEGPGAAAWDAGRLDVFARGTGNAIWHVWFDGAGWHPWESLGGSFSYGASASSWGTGRLDVFARNSSGAVQHRAYEGGWSPWENLGGAAGGNPAAASWGPARIDVFIRHQNA
ncbi:MAG TPA: SpoIID/LytB domain-containing protein, partial [Dehalococcoidia bacterium]|nr:SpoIID/LytB domain-containing protein [Dehalococcoidia bacterium]